MEEASMTVRLAPSTLADAEQLDNLRAVLDLVRSGEAVTRPELSRLSGLGRTVVTQRVNQLMSLGLISDGSLGASTGGRAPRELRFRAEAGYILAVQLGAASMSVGVTNLSAEPLVLRSEPWNIANGPEETLQRVEELFDELLEGSVPPGTPVWGVGVGLPGPVEFSTGRPIAPPIMPGWDGYPIRERLSERYQAPVWVDNDVNVLALNELRAGAARGHEDVIYVKIGTGIGAGLVSGSRLHRGSQGCAGDIGHIAVVDDPAVVCRCGNIGCLEAVAGGGALSRDGTIAAQAGRSPLLAEVLATGRSIEASDVVAAAGRGDPVCVEMLTSAGRRVGDALATLVSFFNPSRVIVGGGVAAAGDSLLAALKQSVYRRSLPLATRDLVITRSQIDDGPGGMRGAAFMAIDGLFSARYFASWIAAGSPAHSPDQNGTGTDADAQTARASGQRPHRQPVHH
jgi:glucokinase-like ROK family protein